MLYGLTGAYPFLEAWVTGDKREHHLLDRPRNAPTRTGLGVMALVFYFCSVLRCGNDLIAIKLHLSINDITNLLRVSCLRRSAARLLADQRICLSLQRRDRELVLHGRETGRIVRTAEGKFFEVPRGPRRARALGPGAARHAQVLDARRPSVDEQRCSIARAPPWTAPRATVSSFCFSNRVDAVTPAELAAAHHDGTTHEALHEPAPVRDRQLHGGADERPDTDAYAPHARHEHATEGALREADPEAETTSTH